MAKRELPDKKTLKDSPMGREPSVPFGGLSGKVSGLSGRAFSVIKFILGILLLPFVYSSVTSFLNEFVLVNVALQWTFWSGVVCFLIIYLFIWEPAPVYNYGHKPLETAFSFVKPMVNVAPFLLPIYAILVFIFYGILSFFIKSSWLIEYTLFLVGFSAIMHLVFSSRSIRTKKDDFLKGNYIFGFSFILILNLTLLALGFSLIFREYSFVNFCNASCAAAGKIFYAVFRQLFIF